MGDPHDHEEGNVNLLPLSDSSEYEAKAIIKMEYILILVGPQQQLVKFLIGMGGQISILSQQDAEKLGM